MLDHGNWEGDDDAELVNRFTPEEEALSTAIGSAPGTERERRARAFLENLQSGEASGERAQPSEAVRGQLEAMGYGGR